jgi:ATP-dependent DNA ligase
MLTRPVAQLPAPSALPGGCLYEPRWEGYRVLVQVGPDGARLQTGRGDDCTLTFPEIAAAAAAQLAPGTVLDGELVVWSGRALDVSALHRRAGSARRGAALAVAHPASFMAFDVLALDGLDLRELPLRERRAVLEGLTPALAPPLRLTPATRNASIAVEWLRRYRSADVGVEGLVVKGRGEPYRPGRRGWLEFRTRSTVEAVVGAVTGAPDRPERLILGVVERGVLVVAGCTDVLLPGQARAIAPLLRPAVPGGHPWPADLPTTRLGSWTTQRRLPVTLVRPTLVVEIAADPAVEQDRRRLVVRYVRPRPDLDPADVGFLPRV